MITHKHHIIPKHAGGTDDPSNLIEITVEEHAEAHKKLWEEHGRWQDKVAYDMLSGHIGNEEAIKLAQKFGKLGKVVTEETRTKQSLAKKGKKQKPETIEKRRLKLLGQKRNMTDKWKQNISNGKKGQTPWITGKKHTEESKEKNRISHIGTTYNRGRVFQKVLCNNCNKLIATNVINRHNISCKVKSNDNI